MTAPRAASPGTGPGLALRARFVVDRRCVPVLAASALLFCAARATAGASSALALATGLWCGYCVAFVAIALACRGSPSTSRATAFVVAAIAAGAGVGRAAEAALWRIDGLGWTDEALRLALHVVFVATLVLVPIAQSIASARRLARVEEERARLTSRLLALQAQIEPHFLFNTLATLRALIRRDATLAADLLDRMTAFLRAVLPDARQTTSTLSREIAIVESYLAIMRVRLGERLAYAFDVAPDTLDAATPPLLLQPLVENAILHGIEPCETGGRVDIATIVDGDALIVSIRNTGEALKDDSTPSSRRTGLLNVRHRLAALYPGAAAFSLATDRDGATVATLRFPLSLAA